MRRARPQGECLTCCRPKSRKSKAFANNPPLPTSPREGGLQQACNASHRLNKCDEKRLLWQGGQHANPPDLAYRQAMYKPARADSGPGARGRAGWGKTSLTKMAAIMIVSIRQQERLSTRDSGVKWHAVNDRAAMCSGTPLFVCRATR